jgi:hypothetical protein
MKLPNGHYKGVLKRMLETIARRLELRSGLTDTQR